MGTQHQYEPTATKHHEPAEISGRSWQVTAPGVAKCCVPPGHRVPREAQVTTPHPGKPGWKVAWIFLPLLCVIMCLGVWLVCHSASIGAVVLL